MRFSRCRGALPDASEGQPEPTNACDSLGTAGPIEELCRWTVDLSPLPTFQQNAQLAREGASPNGFGAGNGSTRDGGGGGEGFYTEFALGLVLDSAEVIGAFFGLSDPSSRSPD